MIKLWLNKKSWEDLAWDNLVKKTTRSEFKAKIWKDRDLDQRYPWGKRVLKLMKKVYDNQLKNAQQKISAVLQGQNKTK